MRLPSSGRPVKEPRVGLSTARTSSTNTATTSGVQEATRGTVPNAVTPQILAIIFRGIRSLRVIVRVSRVSRDWRVASKDPVRWLFPRSPPSSHLNTAAICRACGNVSVRSISLYAHASRISRAYATGMRSSCRRGRRCSASRCGCRRVQLCLSVAYSRARPDDSGPRAVAVAVCARRLRRSHFS